MLSANKIHRRKTMALTINKRFRTVIYPIPDAKSFLRKSAQCVYKTTMRKKAIKRIFSFLQRFAIKQPLK